MRTNIRVQNLTVCKNLTFTQRKNSQFFFCLARKTIESWYKKILRIQLRRFATPPNTEYIFFQLAVDREGLDKFCS